MSDNIPFDVQMEIVKRVSSVKSLIQFGSVSKQWKSFIDNSKFIKGYGAHHTHPHSHILSNMHDSDGEDPKYMHLVDDDMETFKVQQQKFAPIFVFSFAQTMLYLDPFWWCYWCKLWIISGVILVVLLVRVVDYVDIRDYMLVIWNPSIGKSFGIALPSYGYLDSSGNIYLGYGFGVCPVTSDPTVVEFVCERNMLWHVKVFTLSSGVWNVIPSDRLPRQTIRLIKNTQVVIDKCIYWVASENTNANRDVNHMVVSFDLITHEFKVVNLPDALRKLSVNYPVSFSVSKLRGSLVVCKYKSLAGEAGVWVMENDSSFRKLFTIHAPRIRKILGFKKNGEIIFISGSQDAYEWRRSVPNVYDPCSQQIKNLGISGEYDSFFMGAYKESLLLLDHLDSHIYQDNSDQDDDYNI